jgi:hypothetical protein
LGTNSSIVELANGGIDEVFAVDTSFSIATLGNVENLTLVGTSTVAPATIPPTKSPAAATSISSKAARATTRWTAAGAWTA